MSTDVSQTTPATSDNLQVPGEPGVYYCAHHKNVQTRLRCGRCEAPICPKCTTFGPTGARCKECVSNRTSHIYQVSPLHHLLAFAISLGTTLVGVFLMSAIPFFALLYALVAGNLTAKAVVKATHGKRGTSLAVVATAGVVAGLLPAIAISAGSIFAGSLFVPLLLLYGTLTVVGIWNWLR
jgi:hypothetical protein